MQEGSIIKTNRFFCLFSILVIGIAIAKIVFQLGYWHFPLLFLMIGFGTGLWNFKKSLNLFFFLFPFITALPALIPNGYPFNYMAIPLFLLSGIFLSMVLLKFKALRHPETDEPYLDQDFFSYYVFLIFLIISALFVFSRWSNFFPVNVAAIGADTPVAPQSPQSQLPLRISFGSIFPVVSLFIYLISPFIFFFIKRIKPEEKEVFKFISFGFYVSLAMALGQYLSGKAFSDNLGKTLKQVNGGFSDFNAFGFFSGVLFLWATYEISKKNRLAYITFVAALAGGILSGSRSMFFFILAGLFNIVRIFLFNKEFKNKKSQKWMAALLIAGVALMILFAGGTLKKRFTEGLSKDKSLYEQLDAVSNGRLWMTAFTMKTIGDCLIPGVGTGNFTFYLAYQNYEEFMNTRQPYLYDLTLNQYLLVFAENGLFAFLFFTFFLFLLWFRSNQKLLIGTILFSLLLNNFFWFPEAFLLFWIVAALSDKGSQRNFIPHLDSGLPSTNSRSPFSFSFSPLLRKILIIICLAIFLFFNIFQYRSLMPLEWAQKAGFIYDYGFWYPEKDPEGRLFQWSKGKAGHFLTIRPSGFSRNITLVCSAPLDKLPGKKQQVNIYWKGKPYLRFTFTEKGEKTFSIQGRSQDSGFLEIHTIPVFNEKKLQISQERRDLGVRVYLEPVKREWPYNF